MILLGHGSGGRLSHDLITEHFLPRLGNPALSTLADSAVIDGGELAVTTDAYVVSPLVFPGGDIGRLAVCGTVNDLCMAGAVPLGLTAAFIIEEGFALAELDPLVDSMAAAADEAGVSVVAGDTKVVPRGACDGIFITTSGVGRLDKGFRPEPRRVVPGDAIVVSGSIGDHGLAVLSQREGLRLAGELRSDVAPLGRLVDKLRQEGLPVHALRDPTRGGVTQSILEVADAATARVVLREDALPVRPVVRSACELLGLDPLYVANEGKLIAFLPADHADRAVELLRTEPLGRDAAIIGEVEAGTPGGEILTALGTRRSLRMAAGELLPRIC